MAAADLAQQPPAMNNYYNHYTGQQQQHPPSTPLGMATPTNMSPTSPRGHNNVTSPPASLAATHLPYQTRQLRPPKCPIYVPAVLRPTERPAPLATHGRVNSKESGLRVQDHGLAGQQSHHGQGPPTPPSSAGNSYDGEDVSAEDQHLADAYAGQPPTPGFGKMLDDDFATTGITRLVTDEWNDGAMEDVTGAPTRDHWKPDSSTMTCDFPSCPITFSLLNRRHHCRRCGQIFCGAHSSYTVPLDQHARFHKEGYPARACGSCARDLRAWEVTMGKMRPGRGSGSSSGSTTPVTIRGERRRRGEADDGATPPSSVSAARPAKGAGGGTNVAAKGKNAVEMFVGSLTRDWNWSTF